MVVGARTRRYFKQSTVVFQIDLLSGLGAFSCYMLFSHVHYMLFSIPYYHLQVYCDPT